MKEVKYEIVDDRPVPGRAQRTTYPFFGELKVGQCSLIDVGPRQNNGQPTKEENRIRVAATKRNQRSDKKFIVRMIPDKENHVGVWRVE